jgi:hypothetical protein
MALGGWVSGAIFDFTGSYHATFLNGLVWNFLNMAIAAWIITRRNRRSHWRSGAPPSANRSGKLAPPGTARRRQLRTCEQAPPAISSPS